MVTQMVVQNALRVKTTVLAGGRIEIAVPQLEAGEAVELIVLPAQPQPAAQRSVLDILNEAKGHRIFKTMEDVEAYLREERESWDR